VLKTYVDGAVVASKTVNKPRSKGKESLNIGRRVDGHSYFEGLIDEVRFYNRALSDDEIAKHSREPLAAKKKEPGLVRAWDFENLSQDGELSDNAAVIKRRKWIHARAPNPTQEMSDKIAYAKKRWGCRLFYMDSNIRWQDDTVKIPGAAGYSAMPEPLAGLLQEHPDVLIMPEWEDVLSYAHSAPYSALQHDGMTGPPARVMRAYPSAFLANVPFGNPSGDRLQQIAESVKRGDILFFDGWWANPENHTVKSIYDDAHR